MSETPIQRDATPMLLIGRDPRQAQDYYIDPEETLKHVIQALASRHRPRRDGVFWGRVCELTYLGSNYSFALCRWAGVDPETGKALAT